MPFPPTRRAESCNDIPYCWGRVFELRTPIVVIIFRAWDGTTRALVTQPVFGLVLQPLCNCKLSLVVKMFADCKLSLFALSLWWLMLADVQMAS